MTQKKRNAMVIGAVVGLVVGLVLFSGDRSLAAAIALSIGLAIPAGAVGYFLARDGSGRR